MYRLGEKTKFGKVVGITFTCGERYYFLKGKGGTISLLPADAIEKS